MGPPADGPPSLKAAGKEGAWKGEGRDGLGLSPPPLLSFTGQLPLGRCPSAAASCKGTSLFMQLVGMANSPPYRCRGKVAGDLPSAPGGGGPGAFRLHWCTEAPRPPGRKEIG